MNIVKSLKQLFITKNLFKTQLRYNTTVLVIIRENYMKNIFIISLCSLISLPTLADSWRCGNNLVNTGDTKGVVLAKCGNPYSETQLDHIKQRKNNEDKYITTEELLYKDDGKVYRILTFEGGKLSRITFERCNPNSSPLCD